jgi:hypothetical protein
LDEDMDRSEEDDDEDESAFTLCTSSSNQFEW